MRRRTALAGGGAVRAATSIRSASAQAFPDKPITLICPWPAGGGADQHMRALAAATSKHLPHPMTVDNRAGGSGVVDPAGMAATARPDGYTICQMVVTVFRAPHMQKVSFDPLKDFTWIIHVTGFLIGTFCKADAPFASARDAIDFARANPGKLTYGSPGTGTTNHLTFAQLALKAGVQAVHVPFRGEAEMYAAVLGGHVMLGVGTAGAGSLIDAGQFRWLHTYGRQRTKRWPQVPTAKELGYNVVGNSPYGLVGPKGMDPAVVKVLHDAFKKAMDDPKHLELLDQLNQDAWYRTGEDYAAWARETFAKDKLLIERLGLAAK